MVINIGEIIHSDTAINLGQSIITKWKVVKFIFDQSFNMTEMKKGHNSINNLAFNMTEMKKRDIIQENNLTNNKISIFRNYPYMYVVAKLKSS